jgi:hypothetical protein
VSQTTSNGNTGDLAQAMMTIDTFFSQIQATQLITSITTNSGNYNNNSQSHQELCGSGRNSSSQNINKITAVNYKYVPKII